MYCQSCGKEVGDGAEFCRYCGEDLDPEHEPELEPAIRPTASGSESEPKSEPEPEESETSSIKKLGYWGGRIVQLILIGLAVIFVGGGVSMNAIAFIMISLFALVLLAFAAVIEFLVVRPSSG